VRITPQFEKSTLTDALYIKVSTSNT